MHPPLQWDKQSDITIDFLGAFNGPKSVVYTEPGVSSCFRVRACARRQSLGCHLRMRVCVRIHVGVSIQCVCAPYQCCLVQHGAMSF